MLGGAGRSEDQDGNDPRRDSQHTKAINIKEKLNIYQINENLRLAINSAKAIGCIVNLSTDMIYHK